MPVARAGEDAEQAADFMLGSGPGLSVLSQSPDAEAAAWARRALAGAFAAHQRPGGVHLHASAWLVTAQRP